MATCFGKYFQEMSISLQLQSLVCPGRSPAPSLVLSPLITALELPRVDGCYTARMHLPTSLAVFGAIHPDPALSVL